MIVVYKWFCEACRAWNDLEARTACWQCEAPLPYPEDAVRRRRLYNRKA